MRFRSLHALLIDRPQIPPEVAVRDLVASDVLAGDEKSRLARPYDHGRDVLPEKPSLSTKSMILRRLMEQTALRFTASEPYLRPRIRAFPPALRQELR